MANIQIGPLPKVVYLAFVESESFHGAHGKNPFNFKLFGLTHLSIKAEGIPFPTKPFQLNTAEGRTLEGYDGLLDCLGKKNSGWGDLPFNRDDWSDGYAIFGADLTPGHSGRGHMSLVRQGNLSVRVQFSAPIAQSIICLVYMVYDNILGK